jgi:phosphatidylcholine synthase
MPLVVVWAMLVIYALANDFNAGPIVTIALCAIAVYIVGSDAVIRLLRSLKA